MTRKVAQVPGQRRPATGLTDAQERFCEAYLVSLNATKAYQAAYGVKAKSARTAGSRLLANVDIAARIQALMVERTKRMKIDADNVFASIVAVRERALSADSPDLGNALRANELLGKHLGMFKPELVPTSVQFVIEVPAQSKSAEEWQRQYVPKSK